MQWFEHWWRASKARILTNLYYIPIYLLTFASSWKFLVGLTINLLPLFLVVHYPMLVGFSEIEPLCFCECHSFTWGSEAGFETRNSSFTNSYVTITSLRTLINSPGQIWTGVFWFLRHHQIPVDSTSKPDVIVRATLQGCGQSGIWTRSLLIASEALWLWSYPPIYLPPQKRLSPLRELHTHLRVYSSMSCYWTKGGLNRKITSENTKNRETAKPMNALTARLRVDVNSKTFSS